MNKNNLLTLCILLILTTLSGQTTLINWTFENLSKRALITDDASFVASPYTADDGISGNLNTRSLKTVGRPVFSGWVNGSGGTGTYAPTIVNWVDGNALKAWQISLVTIGYTNITLSSKQYSSSTGPRDFKVQYSLNETTWTDVPGAATTVGSNWTSGLLNNISLPGACNNQPAVYLRWIMTSNTSVGGSTVQTAGGSRIDDILIAGESTLIPEFTVTPGELGGFTYILDNGPSAEQTIQVSGSNLTGPITLTAPTDYQISLGSGVSFVPTSPLTLSPSGGSVVLTTVYARLKSGLQAGTYNAQNVVASTPGASNQTVVCNGYVSTPAISVTTSLLTGFSYMVGLGPSAEQSFTVSGSNLYTNLNVSASANIEVSATSGVGFTTSISLTPSFNSVPPTTIYARLKEGLALGNYFSESVTASASGATTRTVVCEGSVSAGSPPDSPTALAATNVNTAGFTAHWSPVNNSTHYRLDVYTGSASASDLLISEYVEGLSFNKYLEIFNGTGADVNLADYRLQLFSNGATTPTNNVLLSGILPSGSCVVYQNNQAALTLPPGVTPISNSAVNFNGDDAVALYKISTASYVDIFGRIGEQPSGGAWGTDPLITADKTLVRKYYVTEGVSINPSSGFPTLATEWDSYPLGTSIYLGSHQFGSRAISYVPGYENLDVGSQTSYLVTGLEESTEYHYVVRAQNPYGTSLSSNEIDVTTTSSTAPLITLQGTLSSFSTTQGSASASQSYTLFGANLTGPINLTIPAGFEVSVDGEANYYSGFTSVAADYSGLVHIRLSGAASGTYSGNITHSSSGAASENQYVFGIVTGQGITVPTVQASNITGYPALTSLSLEWTPGNGSARVVKINTVNNFTVPADGTSPSVSTGYSGSGEQVIYNGSTEFIEGQPFNGCTITNLVPNTTYWFRIFEYNGTGLDTQYLSVTAANNPRSLTTNASSGSGYYSSIYGYGCTLKTNLHNLIRTTHTTQFSYTATTNQIKYTDEDPANPNNLIEIYTGWSVDKETFGNNPTNWNREHTWSKSHGDFGDVAPAGTDLHHLRPCDATVNSTKSNKDFAVGGSAVIDSSPPTGYTGDTGCFQTYNTWEPRPADKGDVARMIMYMAVRYEGTDTPYDLELVDYVYTDGSTNEPLYGKLATLLQWHVQDPPDARELQRHNRIAERQGNRNPFIDMPGYAARIWAPCPLYNSDVTTTSFIGWWSTPITATDYYLQVASDSLFTNLVAGYENLDIDLQTSRTISGLTPGGTYYYRLRSFFLDDYGMYSPYLQVVLNSPVTATATLTPQQALQEINLDGALMTITLANSSFADASLATANFVLNNAPAGLSLQSVSYLSPTSALLTLSYPGADFDENYPSFSITIAAVELSVAYNVTSSAVPITAHVESTAVITLEDGLAILTIAPVSGAVQYYVFACDEPYGNFTDITPGGSFDLVLPNVWRISAQSHNRRFFMVSAIRN